MPHRPDWPLPTPTRSPDRTLSGCAHTRTKTAHARERTPPGRREVNHPKVVGKDSPTPPKGGGEKFTGVGKNSAECQKNGLFFAPRMALWGLGHRFSRSHPRLPARMPAKARRCGSAGLPAVAATRVRGCGIGRVRGRERPASPPACACPCVSPLRQVFPFFGTGLRAPLTVSRQPFQQLAERGRLPRSLHVIQRVLSV